MISAAREIRSVQQDIAKLGRLAAYQLRLAVEAFRAQDRSLAENVIEKDDVADNLNLAVEDRCFRLAASGDLSEEELRFARSAVKVAANLERVADAACHIAKRVRFIEADGVTIGSFDLAPVEAIALPAVAEACDAYLAGDLQAAERVCGREPQLDAVYIALLAQLRARMQAQPDELLYLDHVQSVMKYLERVGDYVLNIGEQAIYRITGRRMKFEQYQQLDWLTGGSATERFEFQPYWDGISGALVGRVQLPTAAYLYKEGSHRKIEAEVRKSSEWERVLAGSTPRVVGVTTLGDREALLREFVRGTLLVDMLTGPAAYHEKLTLISSLLAMVETVWQATLLPEPAPIDYVAQIRARLGEVYALHPQIERFSRNGRRARGIESLLARASELEKTLGPPFAVWLHGDFNANNVLVDSESGQMKFIDVYRSHYGDFLSDLSVFVVSLERLGVSPTVRRQLGRLQRRILLFGEAFAEERGDRAYHTRLRLALARSLMTSARVIVDDALARSLFRRGVRLLTELTREP